MRMLMQSEHIPTLKSLGFPEDLTENLNRLLTHPHGMILVTGPTGSGKSTTLHACLQHIATPDKNIITVEDPKLRLLYCPRIGKPKITRFQIPKKGSRVFDHFCQGLGFLPGFQIPFKEPRDSQELLI